VESGGMFEEKARNQEGNKGGRISMGG